MNPEIEVLEATISKLHLERDTWGMLAYAPDLQLVNYIKDQSSIRTILKTRDAVVAGRGMA